MKAKAAFIAMAGLMMSLVDAVKAAEPAADPIEALAGIWDVRCAPGGCMMFKDVMVGGPQGSTEPDGSWFITISVAIAREPRGIAFISFIAPPDFDPATGLRLFFTDMRSENDNWTMDVSKDVHKLAFEKCDIESCVVRLPGGLADEVSLVELFLNHGAVVFDFSRSETPRQIMEPLFPFQRAYKSLMEGELKAP